MGKINFMSMLLLGGAMAVFVMAWQITTFIIHSHRVPFMGATRHAFLKYCINNSILPLTFLMFYSFISIRFQWFNEEDDVTTIIRFQLSFYFGFLIIIFLSFLYFFRVDRDLLKVVLSKITNPSRAIREIIPYDSLDYEVDIIRAETYLSGRLQVKRCSELEPYHPRLLHTVLRKHHRNAITATIFSILLLLLLGIFMEDPRLRIPAGAGFLILFSIIMGLVGAMKYFLRSWEILGWVMIGVFLSWLVKMQVFDVRSRAYGVDYNTSVPYNYDNLKTTFNPQRYEADKQHEEQRLNNWKSKVASDSTGKHPLIVIGVSGGGSRSAYWTFRSLQYLDSITRGKVFNNTVLLTGASGGMIGAAYWRELHTSYREGKIQFPYAYKYQENIGKDLLNAIIFSFASIDLISPFNKMSIAGYSYTKDRGYAMEQELIRNTEGLLDRKIGDYQAKEANGSVPAMIINGTIVNDGRRLMMSAQPLSYLCRSSYSLPDSIHPPIDAVDFTTYFYGQNPLNMRLTTALRMNATFPYILPVVKLPSSPYINVMDAGLRDNFGVEVISRYLFVMKEWIENNVSEVIYLQIRDTREHEVFPFTEVNSMSEMASEPLFVIQHKWQPFQSYYHSYVKDYAPYFFNKKVHYMSMQYIPKDAEKGAALNFHLTTKEKEDIYNSIHNADNQRTADTLLKLLGY
jgi:hypothetical protein